MAGSCQLKIICLQKELKSFDSMIPILHGLAI